MNKHYAESAKCTASTPLLRSPSPIRLTVAGVGALGSELCLQLNQASRRYAGPGWPLALIRLLDPDRVEARNLGLSRLFPVGGVGRNKASFAAQLLGPGSPFPWRAIPLEIADVGWQVLRNSDLLVSCVDSALARSEIALAARSVGLPMLDGGVSAQGGPHGRVAWFPAHTIAACYLCGVAETARAEILAYGFSPALGCSVPPPAQPLSGSLQASGAIQQTAAAMVRAILHYAGSGAFHSPDPQQAGALRLTPDVIQTSAWRAEPLSLPRSATCPWHQDPSGPLVPLHHRRPFRDGLSPGYAERDRLRIQLAWPICLEARCLACGLRQQTRQRLGKLRQRGGCAGCGRTGTLEALRTISSIGAQDPEAGRTPRQLGLPDRHLYRLRGTMAMAGEEENRS